MTTAKHEVFIGLQHENYLVGVMKLWCGSLLGVFFPGGGRWKDQMFGQQKGDSSDVPQQGKPCKTTRGTVEKLHFYCQILIKLA